MKNYYSILDVPTNALQADIKKAYRALAVQYHPDKNNGDSSSEERFKEISEAYIVLGDVAKRNAYDFAKGYQTSFRASDINASGQTPVTFLLLFKKVKNRVLNAGGRVKQEALFKVIDDLLSAETIKFLVTCGDTATNSIIIDDILTSCIFLDDADRAMIYTKLIKLADGNNWLLSKVHRLKETSLVGTRKKNVSVAEQPSKISIVIFIVLVVSILAVIISNLFN